MENRLDLSKGIKYLRYLEIKQRPILWEESIKHSVSCMYWDDRASCQTS